MIIIYVVHKADYYRLYIYQFFDTSYFKHILFTCIKITVDSLTLHKALSKSPFIINVFQKDLFH